MDSLEPHQRAVLLRCPECHDPEALACKVTRTGEGIWVTLIHQFCDCDAYANWDAVWEQARARAIKDTILTPQEREPMQHVINIDDTPDRILRLALLACACDRRSALTRGQRETIVQLGRQETGVPLAMILPLREPLLAWCKEYRPRLTAMVSEQLVVLDHRQDALEQAREVVRDGEGD